MLNIVQLVSPVLLLLVVLPPSFAQFRYIRERDAQQRNYYGYQNVAPFNGQSFFVEEDTIIEGYPVNEWNLISDHGPIYLSILNSEFICDHSFTVYLSKDYYNYKSCSNLDENVWKSTDGYIRIRTAHYIVAFITLRHPSEMFDELYVYKYFQPSLSSPEMPDYLCDEYTRDISAPCILPTAETPNFFDKYTCDTSAPCILPTSAYSLEIITGDSLPSLHFNNTQKLHPVSDIPSCRPGDSRLDCEWFTTASLLELNEADGKVYSVMNNVEVFKTRLDLLQLDSICLIIKYKVIQKKEVLVRLYITPHNGDTLPQIFSTYLDPTNSWTTLKVAVNISDDIKIKFPLDLEMRIENSSELGSGVYIKEIYSCERNGIGNRFFYPANSTTLTIDLLKKIGGRKNENCRNGGVFNFFHSSDTCECPAASIGPTCSQSCSENRFGPNCEGICSLLDGKCKGMLFCNFFIGCHCASGWEGHNCLSECPPGRYGVNCIELCGNCSDGMACDRFTGTCHKGCQNSFKPPFCHESYPKIDTPPIIQEVDKSSAKFVLNISSSEGQISFYQLQYREWNETEWTNSAIHRRWDAKQESVKLVGLNTGTLYEVRAIMMDEDINSYISENLPTVQFETDCSANELNIFGENVTSTGLTLQWEATSTEWSRCMSEEYEVGMRVENTWTSLVVNSSSSNIIGLLPSTKYIFRVKMIRKSTQLPYYYAVIKTAETKYYVTELVDTLKKPKSITLTWNSKSNAFFIVYACAKILSDGQECPWDSGRLDNLKETEMTVKGLFPFRSYTFKVCSHDDCSQITASTRESVALIAPELVSHESNDSSILISWKPPSNCSLCNGAIGKYEVTLKVDSGEVIYTKDIRGRTWLKFDNLTASTVYKIYIAIITGAGASPVPLVVEVKTKATVPSGIMDLFVYKQGRREIGLKWKEPKYLFGNLSMFTVAIIGQPDRSYPHSPARCPAWPSYYCYTITNLKPDAKYNISVSARNDIIDEDGVKAFVSVTTSESAPGEPVGLLVSNETATGFTVTWSPPNSFNGILRSFLVKVEQTESYDPALCCQYYPKKEVTVEQELPTYEAQISGLSPGSTYAVSVMGETVWLGPAAKTTGNTRPVPPSTSALNLPDAMGITSTGTIVQLQWPPKNSKATDDDIRTPFEGRIMLLLPEADNLLAALTPTSWKDKEVKSVVETTIGNTEKYIVIKQFRENSNTSEPVVIEDSSSSEKEYWASSEPVNVPAGSYRMVVIALARYCHLYSATSFISLPFTL